MRSEREMGGGEAERDTGVGGGASGEKWGVTKRLGGRCRQRHRGPGWEGGGAQRERERERDGGVRIGKVRGAVGGEGGQW